MKYNTIDWSLTFIALRKIFITLNYSNVVVNLQNIFSINVTNSLPRSTRDRFEIYNLR